MRKAIGVILTIILIMCNCVGAWASQTTTTYDGTTYGGEGESKDVKGSYSVDGITDVNGDGVPDTDTKNEQSGTSVPDGIPDTVPDYDDVSGDPDSDDITTGNAISPTGATYSVDIVWGDMLFDYTITGSTWDDNNHSYINGTSQWVPRNEATQDALASNEIKVTNHSNVGIRARYVFTGTLKDASNQSVNFSQTTFEEPMMKLQHSVGRLPSSKTAKLMLKGDLGNVSLEDNQTIGSVTIKIDYAIINE